MEETNEFYYRLIELKNQFPELTFHNVGYEYLDEDVQKRHKVQIDEISKILQKTVNDFVKFNNFKPRSDGSFAIRCQYYWDEHFIGVGYFRIEDFKNFKKLTD